MIICHPCFVLFSDVRSVKFEPVFMILIEIITAVRVITVTIVGRSSAAARLSTSAIPSVIGHGENSVCRNYSRNSEHQLLFLVRREWAACRICRKKNHHQQHYACHYHCNCLFHFLITPCLYIQPFGVYFVTVRRISPEPSQNRHTQLSRFPFCSLFPPGNLFCILFYVNIIM